MNDKCYLCFSAAEAWQQALKMSFYTHGELLSLTGITEKKDDGTLKSRDDSFHTGHKSTLDEGTKCQYCVISRQHLG